MNIFQQIRRVKRRSKRQLRKLAREQGLLSKTGKLHCYKCKADFDFEVEHAPVRAGQEAPSINFEIIGAFSPEANQWACDKCIGGVTPNPDKPIEIIGEVSDE